jgi:hypothetical protein
VDLVAKVARQVIRCELTLQPVQLLSLVEETLTALPPTRDDEVEVFLNPEDSSASANWTPPAPRAGSCGPTRRWKRANAACRPPAARPTPAAASAWGPAWRRCRPSWARTMTPPLEAAA